MKRLVVLLALAFATPALARAPGTDEEKTLYALGLAVAQQLKIFALSPADVEMVVAGLTDGATGATPAVPFAEWQAKIGDLAKARSMKAAAAEKAAGQAFLDKAASQPGAKRTPSGLVIVTKQEGQGAQATLADTVKVHYHGTLISGEVFDSSVERGTPATFPLGGVVPCWKEGVALMKKGGKATLYCPPDLAYGDRGAPPKIGPGATLIFDVELLDITPPGK